MSTDCGSASCKGNDGAITGDSLVLARGDNIHSPSFPTLRHRGTDAEEARGIIRRRHAGCVNVANANVLVVEPHQWAYYLRK